MQPLRTSRNILFSSAISYRGYVHTEKQKQQSDKNCICSKRHLCKQQPCCAASNKACRAERLTKPLCDSTAFKNIPCELLLQSYDADGVYLKQIYNHLAFQSLNIARQTRRLLPDDYKILLATCFTQTHISSQSTSIDTHDLRQDTANSPNSQSPDTHAKTSAS